MSAVLLVVLLSLCGSSSSGATPPLWLAVVARQPIPEYPPETEAVVLHSEQTTRVSPKGELTVFCRRAVRILRGSGREAGRLWLTEAYDLKVRSMTGWRLSTDGKTEKVTIKDVVERGLAPDALYSDVTEKVLPVPGVEPGCVVGFEWEEVRTPLSLEDIFAFQERYPVLRALYKATVPPGWTLETHWVHWAGPESKAGPTLSWDISNIPPLVDEPRKPGDRALAGRLLVRVKPPRPDPRSFKTWSDMGAWYDALTRGCREPDTAVAEKARELAADAPDTMSALRALGGFVQNDVRYVAIEIGIGGVKPHPAASVLANRYGDCKDKATLMVALLKARGIEAGYMLVHSERGNVTPESPVSRYSFNHVVLAIRLPDGAPAEGLPALLNHPRLGRLLVFDPTSPVTPLGHLPYYLQGNTALLVAEGGGELVSLPLPAPEANLLDRQGRFQLKADGTLEGEIRETSRGSIADETRYVLLNSSATERTRFMERFLDEFLAGASLESTEFGNLERNDLDLVLTYRIRAPRYAKVAGELMIVRPRVVGRKSEDLEPEAGSSRRYPIAFDGTSLQRDEFVIEMPEGFRVDGLPAPVDLDAGFAVYRSAIEQDGGVVVYRREYRMTRPLVPASGFAEAVKFYTALAADERQSLVLKKVEGSGG